MSENLQTPALAAQSIRKPTTVVALAALGVVYGDIGTSTLYGLKQAVEAGGAPTPDTVVGIVSVILWSLILIVTLKYAILILRADNHGEGGIVALLALLDVRHAPPGSWRASLLVVGLVGAALLYGDGVITPAISVLSAVEGLKLDAPALAPMVLPITIAILIGLFLVQSKGTDFIGNIFGPIMLAWFIAIGLLGLLGIMRAPDVLAAISPHYAVAYLIKAGPGIAFAVLGAAFLALTGARQCMRIWAISVAGRSNSAGSPSCCPLSAQLPRPGRTASGGPPCRGESVLPARTPVGALSAGRVRHHRDRDRLAIHHFRRVFSDPTGDAAWLSAPHAGDAHRQPREGSNLHPDRELAAGRRHDHRRAYVRLI